MQLARAVLRNVDESKPLSEQGDLAIPLLGLAEAYNSLHERCAAHVEIVESTTGAQLIAAIGELRLKDQVALLHLYRDNLRMVSRANHQPAPSSASAGASQLDRLKALEEEERIKFHALARKVLLLTAAPIPPLLTGAMIAISWNKGLIVDSVIAKGLMSTATEMLKLIFSI